MSTPFEPIRIGSLELKNRIAMAPIKTAFGTTDGRITPTLVSYFRRRADGGVGLILSEPLAVHSRGREHPKQINIDTDDAIGGLITMVDAVHRGGSHVFAHLNHGGRAANPKASGSPPEAPSNVPCPVTRIEPQVLTESRIHQIVDSFADAARRARKSGFDGVELQFGLGYLVSQFLSPAVNKRSDGYGGNEERRMRFAREVFAAVRKSVGAAFPIAVRISASEQTPDGLNLDDAAELARRLERWGADLLHVVTGSCCDSLPWYFQHMSLPSHVNETLASRIRQEVKLPVMAAGRLGDPPRLREVLRTGMVDLVALGRPLLADPDLPKKMADGRDAEVLLCGHCLQGCFMRVKSGEGIGCNINPELGHEVDDVEYPAHPRRVVVVGGGPAGMQAALSAKRRGHAVTLFEEQKLGGQFALAWLAPGKARLKQPFQSLVAQVERSGVTLRLGEKATVGILKDLGPDRVIIATGSRPVDLHIPGLDDPLTGEDVLAGTRETGHTVLIVGGGMIGLEVAEFLARQGKNCVVIKRGEEIGRDMNPISRIMLLKRLLALPVEIKIGMTLLRVEDGHAIVERASGEFYLGRFDSVVIAKGNRSFDPLSAALRREGITFSVVGDAAKPAKVFDAVSAGHLAALSI